METQVLIDQLAAADPERRKAARQALAALGPSAADALLAALVDEQETVDGGTVAWLLRPLGEAVLAPLIEVIASTESREVSRWARYAFTGLQVAELDVYLPALRHPHPDVRAGAAQVFQRGKDTSLPHASSLARLLGDPVEEVRERALWAFQDMGPATVPLLRRIRRSGADALTRRTALVGLVEVAGPSALDAGDQALIRRLIRIRQLDEVPEAMHLCGSWFALPTDDQEAVLDAFGLTGPVPVTMRLGGAAWNRDHHDWSATGADHRGCARVYVSPALNGWTLVFGDRAEDAHRIDSALREECHGALRENAERRCADLSRRFGAAHWYGMSCGDDWTSWCIAEQGEVVRFYDAETCDDEQGPQHPAEEGYLLPHEDGFPDDAFAGSDVSDSQAFLARYQQVKHDLGIPDTCYAVDIAGRISVDPGALSAATRVTGHGVLGLTSCGRDHGHPRGALRI